MQLQLEVLLAGAGIVLLLAAILGGGITIRDIRIPPIPRRWQRITIGVLGFMLLGGGLYTSFSQPSEPKPPPKSNGNSREIPLSAVNDRTDRPRPEPDRHRDRRVAVTTLVGQVDLWHHAADFHSRYTYYSITASIGPTQEFGAALDIQGQFRIDGIPEAPHPEVSWSVSQPGDFVIWPLVHPQVPPGKELQGFRFRRLSDVFHNEKNRMIEAVQTGKFSEANERLSTIRQLFARLGVGGPSNDSEAVQQILRWKFTIHRDLAYEAHEYRTRVGRSKITDYQVIIERQWRRSMIGRALDQPAAGQQLRDFDRSANSWAAYARQVFSQKQQHWPDRSLESRQTSGEFLERDSWAAWLREDIALIQEKLNTLKIRTLVDENKGQMAELSDGQRLAVESFSSLLGQDPGRVSLNQFVNLLSALQRLGG